jgi:hypothetical protein
MLFFLKSMPLEFQGIAILGDNSHTILRDTVLNFNIDFQCNRGVGSD